MTSCHILTSNYSNLIPDYPPVSSIFLITVRYHLRSGIYQLYDVAYMWNAFLSFAFMMVFSIVFSLIIG